MMVWTPTRVTLAAITSCVVAAGVGAGILFQPTKDRPAAADRGAGVNIAVVAPREPVPEPGSIMDVGDLADGYSHRDYVPPAAVDPWSVDGFDHEPPAPNEPEPFERSRVIESRRAPAPAPVIVERREPPPQRRWPFGFDQPRPDYAAERRERQARMEAQRRFEDSLRAERVEERNDYPEPPRYQDRVAPPDREPRGRERQWYSSDGRPVAGPDDPTRWP